MTIRAEHYSEGGLTVFVGEHRLALDCEEKSRPCARPSPVELQRLARRTIDICQHESRAEYRLCPVAEMASERGPAITSLGRAAIGGSQ